MKYDSLLNFECFLYVSRFRSVILKVNICRRAQRFIFVGTQSHPASLLHGLEDDLLDPEIDDELLQGLLKASKKGTKASFKGKKTNAVSVKLVFTLEMGKYSYKTIKSEQYVHAFCSS